MVRAANIWPFRAAANVIYTGLFGGRELEFRGDGVVTISLPPKCGLLDFDLPATQVLSSIEELRAFAQKRLFESYVYPERAFRTAGEFIASHILTGLTMEPGESQSAALVRLANQKDDDGNVITGKIRVFFSELDETKLITTMISSYGFEGDADDQLDLPLNFTLAGMSARDAIPYYASKPSLEAIFSGPESRKRRALKWRHLRWCWTIPIIRDRHSIVTPTRFVMAIESNIPLSSLLPRLGAEADARDREWQLGGNGGNRGEYRLMNIWESAFRQRAIDALDALNLGR
jgi:hypothetical protein